jgi:hypothetical protein
MKFSQDIVKTATRGIRFRLSLCEEKSLASATDLSSGKGIPNPGLARLPGIHSTWSAWLTNNFLTFLQRTGQHDSVSFSTYNRDVTKCVYHFPMRRQPELFEILDNSLLSESNEIRTRIEQIFAFRQATRKAIYQ